MRQIANILTDKKLIAGSSALALALGVGASPAHATLVTTPVDQALTNPTVPNTDGPAVSFGPTGDTSGFSAYISDNGFLYLDLAGAGSNTVADQMDAPPCTSPSTGCILQPFSS